MATRKKSVTISSKPALAENGSRKKTASQSTAAPETARVKAGPVKPSVASKVKPVETTAQTVVAPRTAKVSSSSSPEAPEQNASVHNCTAPEVVYTRCAWFKVVYTTLYYISYSAVYSALFVGKVLPENGAIAKGIREGGRAGSEAFQRREAERASAMAALKEAVI